MDYSTMEAGREMDALVSEKVMEREVSSYWVSGVDIKYESLKNHLGRRLAHYSTDIAAAWEVVEKLHLIIGESVGSDGSHWYCTDKWDDQEATVEVCADSAPLAICRAALMAQKEG